MNKVKSYHISKEVVHNAYLRVKKNKGAAGIDDMSIQDFEKDMENNLYKIWNRMSSGSYIPPNVKTVEIPKADGKIRTLGVPTVSDRIAQMVVKIYLEPALEKCFHPDSYGYRPGKSAEQALEVTRRRCWEYDWVIDIDIKGFFDNIDHELMMRAVRAHTQEAWILLYIQRWLKASAQDKNGNVKERTLGTPQGGVISPLLANLFLHYAFDVWMTRKNGSNPFERYADDIVIHCKTEEEARNLQEAIKARFQECRLELHPEKTKIVYCKDSNRTSNSQNEKFDFLGYTFRPRSSRNKKGKLFTNFSPAISDKAKQKLRDEIKGWKKEIRTNKTLKDFAEEINSIVRGWINYYGKFYATELWEIVMYIETALMKWAKKKYEKLKIHWQKAHNWLSRAKKREPALFAHWQWMKRHGSLDRRAV